MRKNLKYENIKSEKFEFLLHEMCISLFLHIKSELSSKYLPAIK